MWNTVKITTSKVQSKWNDNKHKYMYTGNKVTNTVLRYLFLIGLSFVMLFPVIFMLSGAFKSAQDSFDLSVVWIPKNFSFQAFQLAFESLDFLNALNSTLMILIPSVIFQVVSSVLTAYGFARFKFPLKKILFAILIFSIIVPVSSIIIPLYIDFSNMNILKTYLPFYLMSATGFGIRSGLYIFILRQFFRSIPKELEEAAMIDGCGGFKTFLKVMLPNATSAIVTITVLSVVWYWNDYNLSSILLSDNFPLSYNLTMLNQSFTSLRAGDAELTSTLIYLLKDSIVKSACLMVSVPLIAIYVFFQRFLTESIEKTGIVG